MLVFALVLLVALSMTLPAAGADEKPDCPFDGKRPPMSAMQHRERKNSPALCRANLSNADLRKANFWRTNLVGANLREANLSHVDLSDADLTGASLIQANLSGANLSQAELKGALLSGANLTKARLNGTKFNHARLVGTNLTGADLTGADFTGARLTGTNLSNTRLLLVNLAETIFEPQPNSLQSSFGLESLLNLSRVTYRQEPSGLIILREQFVKRGLRRQERDLTFARLRTERELAWLSGDLSARVQSAFSYVAFELTCGYGRDYGRPLRILVGLIPAMTLVYVFALRRRGRGALWRVWHPGRIEKDDGQAMLERLSWEPLRAGRPRGFLYRVGRALGLGLLFSLLSAFQIDWRELNVGNWITRLQPRDYTLRATGWVHVVSGAQSLLSVYLLALWVLTYFGRPFE